MSAIRYLFSFCGRINRAKVWLYLLIVILVELALVAIAAFTLDWSDFLKSAQAEFQRVGPGGEIDPCNLTWPRADTIASQITVGVMILVGIAYIWSLLAIYAKRLHDRNKSAWWLLGYVALPEALGIYAMSTSTNWVTGVETMTLPGQIAYGISALIGLWVFLELYCFRGTDGDNRFGPDPLSNYCDPKNPKKGCVPRPVG